MKKNNSDKNVSDFLCDIHFRRVFRKKYLIPFLLVSWVACSSGQKTIPPIAENPLLPAQNMTSPPAAANNPPAMSPPTPANLAPTPPSGKRSIQDDLNVARVGGVRETLIEAMGWQRNAKSFHSHTTSSTSKGKKEDHITEF